MTEAYFTTLGCIGNVVYYINSNGGFTVVGCYKSGIQLWEIVLTNQVSGIIFKVESTSEI